jgi:hypothetical protein
MNTTIKQTNNFCYFVIAVLFSIFVFQQTLNASSTYIKNINKQFYTKDLIKNKYKLITNNKELISSSFYFKKELSCENKVEVISTSENTIDILHLTTFNRNLTFCDSFKNLINITTKHIFNKNTLAKSKSDLETWVIQNINKKDSSIVIEDSYFQLYNNQKNKIVLTISKF